MTITMIKKIRKGNAMRVYHGTMNVAPQCKRASVPKSTGFAIAALGTGRLGCGPSYVREFFITLLFIAVPLAVILFLAWLPLRIRDRMVESQRGKRQRSIHESLEIHHANGHAPHFHITARLNKEELLRSAASNQKLQQAPWLKITLSVFFTLWLVVGSWDIINMLLGEKPHRVRDWLRGSIGAAFAGYCLWQYWVAPWLFRRNVRNASEMEISLATELDFRITRDGIRLGDEDAEAALIEWGDVDYVELDEDAVRLALMSKDLLWIPRESMFHEGDWPALVEFLRPLAKA